MTPRNPNMLSPLSPRSLPLFAGLVLAAMLLVLTPAVPAAWAAPADARDTVRQLQKQRDDVRRQRARQASQVDALKATNSEITNALNDLSANVSAETDLLEEAKRAVTQAEAEASQARENESTAAAELITLKDRIRSQAVEAYVSSGSDETVSVLSMTSLSDASSRKTIYEVRAAKSLDDIERYRAVQEDLGIARSTAEDASRRAAEHRAEVDQRLTELTSAQDEQQKFADQVDNRIEAELSEAQSLADVDSALSANISQQQSAIAAQLAAQRSAARRRGGNQPTPRGGSVPTLDTIGGSGIVSVRGIRVAASIADALGRLLAAADAAGVSLAGGGYRDPGAQVALRRAHCGSSNYAVYEAPASSCSPPTARPGTSQHERGLAIDFTQGGRTLTRGSQGFQWMAANAAGFGFFNLPSEPWHWSTTGM